RPFASSMHHSTTRLCSSWLRVGLSPVVPTGTRPWVPSAICQLTNPRKAASSTEPFLNGVTRAVNEPLNVVLAAMELLRHAGWHFGHIAEKSIHIGSEGAVKGPLSGVPGFRHSAPILPRCKRRYPRPEASGT